ncbi:MAG TPA: SAM-dependent methyltransferase [Actinomycetota bacterium]|nr:SAM-dependent methyltransferase [Actinomycetota bacterium]
MSQAVAARIREAIADHGPIGFDEFMELALYGAGGFFETPPVGADRHFVTSPHVHPFVFAHCLRDALLDAWHALGEPDPFEIVELGAGDGTLAGSLLEAFDELPRPHVDYVAVELSPGAREAIAGRGLRVLSRFEELEPFEGVAFANELLDNMPFVRARGHPSGVVEIRVGLVDDRLIEVETPWGRPDVAAPSVDDGTETNVPTGSFALLDSLADRMRPGYLLLMDYGKVDAPVGSARGYREHRLVTDLLSQPGDTDITAGVAFDRVVAHARLRGLTAFEPVAQAQALRALGHDRWDRTMREIQSMLQQRGQGTEAVRVWEARSRASLLVDPAGFGGFWWLVLATAGLPRPDWVAGAIGGSRSVTSPT